VGWINRKEVPEPREVIVWGRNGQIEANGSKRKNGMEGGRKRISFEEKRRRNQQKKEKEERSRRTLKKKNVGE